MDAVWSAIDPEFDRSLRARVESLGLDEQVRFLGERDDLPDLFAAADLAVHTSVLPEPFGMVVVEAMAAGTPVVGPGEGAFPDLVRDGVEGRLCAPRDANSLAATLIDVVADRSALASMGVTRRGHGRANRFGSRPRSSGSAKSTIGCSERSERAPRRRVSEPARGPTGAHALSVQPTVPSATTPGLVSCRQTPDVGTAASDPCPLDRSLQSNDLLTGPSAERLAAPTEERAGNHLGDKGRARNGLSRRKSTRNPVA